MKYASAATIHLPTHTSRSTRQLIGAPPMLAVYQFPAYAPELDPVGCPLITLRDCEER